MHETSLAKQILGLALDQARRHDSQRVLRIRGWIAETEALSTEALSFHFAAHATGTAAAGASLDLELTHVRAKCRHCGEVYEPEHHFTLCPVCNTTEAELLGETGFGVTEVELE